MAQITIQQALGNNYENFDTIFDNLFNIHKVVLINEGRGLDPLKNFVKSRLKIRLRPLFPFLSLYDLDTTKYMFEVILDAHFPMFFQNAFVERMLINPDFLDYDNLGQTTSSGTSSTTNTMDNNSETQNNEASGYSGYSVENQGGNFTRNNSNNTIRGSASSNTQATVDSTQKGGMIRLQYMKALQEYIDEKFTQFIDKVKSNIIQLIY